MSTLNELLARAQEVRDEQAVGGNTALRVGQLLADIIQWCADTDADFVESVEHYVAQLNERDGIINWWQSRVLILKTMGSDFDDVDVSSLSNGDLYYDSVGKWLFERENGGSVNGHHPSDGVLYVNLGNGMSYRWDGSAMRAIRPDDVWDAIQNLRDNVDMILAALGNYAFPGGKPATDWSGGVVEFSVTYPSDSKVTHSGAGDTVELGSSLEVTLGIASGYNLYVIKESSVKVYMGGNEVAGAYDATTDTITINNVVGNVVIVAEAMTYVQDGLAFHLDCKNRGGQSGHWIDRIGNVDFTLGSGVTEADAGVEFDGTANAKGVGNTSGLNITSLNDGGTIEAAFIADALTAPILSNTVEGGIGLELAYASHAGNIARDRFASASATDWSKVFAAIIDIDAAYQCISMNYDRAIVNGVKANTRYNSWTAIDNTTTFAIGYCTYNGNARYLNGKIFGIRVYNRKLSESEQMQNYMIDQKRYNIS